MIATARKLHRVSAVRRRAQQGASDPAAGEGGPQEPSARPAAPGGELPVGLIQLLHLVIGKRVHVEAEQIHALPGRAQVCQNPGSVVEVQEARPAEPSGSERPGLGPVPVDARSVRHESAEGPEHGSAGPTTPKSLKLRITASACCRVLCRSVAIMSR